MTKNITARSSLYYSICVFLLLLPVLSRAATGSEVEDEREFSYDPDSENGPHRWGEIHPDWADCGNGTLQSPIDLLNERVQIVTYTGRLKRNYKPSNATLINRGHDIMLSWVGGAGFIRINGTQYQLNQVHWHTPSEHSIDGKRFALEAHLVHESSDGKIAVVGIMYKIGRSDSFLSMLRQDLETIVDTRDVEKVVGVINPRSIKIGSRKFYRYIGSLTVPPCTQDVLWTVRRKIRTVTREQIRLIRDAVHDDSGTNARPTQAINDRSVKLYRPRVLEENRN